MPVEKPRRTSRAGTAKVVDDVDGFLARLEHPWKREIERVRTLILGLDSRIGESIKWNAPSFYLDAHFATFKLRPVDTIQLVLHTGARAEPDPREREIGDPDRLLRWAAKDRCVLTLDRPAEIEAREAAIADVVGQWIEQL